MIRILIYHHAVPLIYKHRPIKHIVEKPKPILITQGSEAQAHTDPFSFQLPPRRAMTTGSPPPPPPPFHTSGFLSLSLSPVCNRIGNKKIIGFFFFLLQYKTVEKIKTSYKFKNRIDKTYNFWNQNPGGSKILFWFWSSSFVIGEANSAPLQFLRIIRL